MSFADEAAAAVNTAFAEFSVPANYTPPGGSASLVRIILKSQDRQVSFGEARPFAEGNIVEVRASEVASPVKGGTFTPGSYSDGTFTPGATTFTIVGDPETQDELRLVWTCRVH